MVSRLGSGGHPDKSGFRQAQQGPPIQKNWGATLLLTELHASRQRRDRTPPINSLARYKLKLPINYKKGAGNLIPAPLNRLEQSLFYHFFTFTLLFFSLIFFLSKASSKTSSTVSTNTNFT